MRFVCAIVLCLAAATASRADVVYADFNPGNPNTGSEVDITGASTPGGYQSYGLLFTAGLTARLDTIQVAFGPSSVASRGTFDPTFNLTLYAAAGGLPGALLETFLLTTGGSASPVTLTATSTLRPTLTGGSGYFLVATPATPTTAVGWTTVSAIGTVYTQQGGAAPRTFQGSLPAVVVNGTVAPVPAPAAWPLLGLGLAALGRRRRG